MTERGDRDRAWFDEDAGPLVRPYAISHGRTRPNRPELDLITLVIATVPPPERGTFAPEYARIITFCQQPQSVVEVSAELELPLVVIRVLISDLIDQNYLIHKTPEWAVSLPDRHMIQAVLDGLREL